MRITRYLMHMRGAHVNVRDTFRRDIASANIYWDNVYAIAPCRTNVDELFYIGGLRGERRERRSAYFHNSRQTTINVRKRNVHYILTCLYPHFESDYIEVTLCRPWPE